jgi:hypothetical protein
VHAEAHAAAAASAEYTSFTNKVLPAATPLAALLSTYKLHGMLR